MDYREDASRYYGNVNNFLIQTREDKETFIRFDGVIHKDEPADKVWIEVSPEEAAERANIERANEYQANFEALE